MFLGSLQPPLGSQPTSPPNKKKHLRFRESKRQEKREQYALENTKAITRTVNLTEEQRAAVIQKFADSYVETDEFEEFISYGEPIDMTAINNVETPATVVITESRIEMPVFSRRDNWLEEILTEDQLASYVEFQQKQWELETLLTEEMGAVEKE